MISHGRLHNQLMQVPCRVPVEYKYAPKYVRLCIVAVNETRTSEIKKKSWLWLSAMEHVVWGFLHGKYNSSVSCV